MQRIRKHRRPILLGSLVLAIVLLLGYAIYTKQQSTQEVRAIPITQFIALAERREIVRASVVGNTVYAIDATGTRVRATREDNYPLTDRLRQHNVEVSVENQTGEFSPSVLIAFIPIVLIIALLYITTRRSGVNNPALSFGKSGARLADHSKARITFADVAGVEEAKQELNEIVAFLKHPERFAALGARTPKGVLLVGPPGTGKTLIARAVAGEAGVPFLSISGSEFVEMFVGVGASRVRDLFRQAKKQAPCIIFVDEIDAVGRQRGSSPGGGNDEREQTLNQLLVEMDGFDARTNIIVIAATNRPDILDSALLRPGRFDRRVTIDVPDIAGRRAILDVHARAKPLGDGINLDTIARQTVGFSGADLANLMNEAAILAGRTGRDQIETVDIEEAMMRVVAGPERRSRVISAYEKSIIAYHEVGHAIAMRCQTHAMPVRKVSVISRGQALGITVTAPSHDTYLMSCQQLMARMVSTLGGRVAEELIFGDVTTGARQDIEQVTSIARRMVTEFGMSDLGVFNWGRREDGYPASVSEELSARIDQATNKLIDEAYAIARTILTERREQLVSVSEHLMRVETVDGDELDALLGIAPLEPLTVAEAAQPALV